MTAAPSRILRTASVRQVEAAFLDQADPPLMERAGAAAARLAMTLLPAGDHVLVIAGPGNNGGDAFVVARLLKEAGYRPHVVFVGAAAKLPADAHGALDAWRAVGGEIHGDIPARHFALAVDGLFGIGLTRPLTGRHADIVERLNALPCPRLALDVPSGLDAETGRILGCAVRATHTATFIALKPGLLTLDGPDHCGAISVHDLDLAHGPDEERRDDEPRDGLLVARELFAAHLRPRRRNSHKGTHGHAGIVGGAPGMAGAALLAGRAALKLGAGCVHVGMLERRAVDPVQPELMLRAADEIVALAGALAIGPGLGNSTAAASLVRAAIAVDTPLVVDADALNLLAAHPVWCQQLPRRAAPTLLTPHPAEAARLLATTTESIQADRVAAALELARRARVLVALKGCGTVIAAPDGRWYINASGNAGLATAGSGDVLTGMAVALLAQGWPARAALIAAVHLHGAAADALVASGCGPIGLTAGELGDAARMLINRWSADA